ncbi:MAG TPA: hypothetical protein VL754_10480 [Verrucomicrobiae bacterium]|nr:hypothetical protein [Verrucomicrobiae bacterium]
MSAPQAASRRPEERDVPAAIAREADLIHRILFGADAPEALKRRYADALKSAPDGADALDGALFERNGDLEAIEFALRRKNPSNALTRRFRIMCYLAEVEAEYFAHFVAERNQFSAGVGALLRAGMRAVYLGMKGAYLARRYGLR